MEKSNNEKIFKQACKLTDLATQIEVNWLYIDAVQLTDKKGKEFSTQYFMRYGLPAIEDNLAVIKANLQEISNNLMDIYDEEEEAHK